MPMKALKRCRKRRWVSPALPGYDNKATVRITAAPGEPRGPSVGNHASRAKGWHSVAATNPAESTITDTGRLGGDVRRLRRASNAVGHYNNAINPLWMALQRR